MLLKVKAWIDQYQLLSAGDTVVAAFSGGADSLTLLHILLALKDEYRLKIVAVHVNHMFRGKESDDDEEFVKKHCHKWGIICYTKSINVPEYIKRTGLSSEEAARKLRYRYLREVAHSLGPHTKIATGHHQSDQAETVLLNLMRGAGSQGLRGMKPVNGDIIRPLLCLTKQEITQFCKQQGFVPRVDSTNFSANYLRNRVRLEIIPQLETVFHGEVQAALCRTAHLVGDEHDFIVAEVKKLWPKLVEDRDNYLWIDTKQLSFLPIAVLREFFRQVIETKRGHLQGISFAHVEKLMEFSLNAPADKIFQLPGGLVAQKGYQDIKFGIFAPPAARYAGKKTLIIPGDTNIPELNVSFHAEYFYGSIHNVAKNPYIIVFDCQKIVLPLYIRTRVAGDRFWPKGMPYSKKLKDFFIDLKVPHEVRDKIPLLCDSKDRILWVVGYRAGAWYQPVNTTVDFLKITLNK